MKIGFSGSRNGMSDKQLEIFQSLDWTDEIEYFHHGDCVGADQQAHSFVSKMLPNCHIYIHPPEKDNFRAFCVSHKCFITMPKPYLERNKDIVRLTDFLIAVPSETSRGTWHAVRYAMDLKKPVLLIRDSGFEVLK